MDAWGAGGAADRVRHGGDDERGENDQRHAGQLLQALSSLHPGQNWCKTHPETSFLRLGRPTFFHVVPLDGVGSVVTHVSPFSFTFNHVSNLVLGEDA